MNMERGFGWHYPPGTPGPRTDEVGYVLCANCGEHTHVSIYHELGSATLIPEECPECGEPWPDDIEERATPAERDWDQERDARMEAQQADEEDRADERNENYPDDIPH